jgi:phosphoribulokinase
VGPCGTVLGVRFDLIQIQIQTNLNIIQIISNFDPSKKDLPELEKFEIKYGSEGIEERINFLHRIFSRFEINFK